MTRVFPTLLSSILFAGSLSLAVLATPDAQAQDRASAGPSPWYGALSGAWLVPRDYDGEGQEWKTYNGYALYGALGYRWSESWRAEAEIGYGTVENDRISVGQASSKVGGDVDYYSATAALYHDFSPLYGATPYLGGGAGLVHQENTRPAATVGGRSFPAGSDSTDLTAFGEIGFSLPVSAHAEIVPAYRYQWIDDGRDGFDDSGIHVARIGLRYWFN